MQASVEPLTRVFQDGVGADVSRRSLQAETSAPSVVGVYDAGAREAILAASELSPAAASERGWLAVYADLFKARLTSLVLLTTMVGFYVGFRGPTDYGLLWRTAAGHGAGGGRRGGVEPIDGTGIRRQDAPDARSPAAIRTPAAADRADGRLRSQRSSGWFASPGGQSHDKPGGGGVAGLLPVRLYAAQAFDVAEHSGGRGSGRAAAIDGMDRGARGIEQRRDGPVCHSGLLASAALHGHRLDLPGGVRPRRLPDAAGH